MQNANKLNRKRRLTKSILNTCMSVIYKKLWYLILGFVLVVSLTITAVIIYQTSYLHVDNMTLEIGTPEYLVNNNQCNIFNVIPWNNEFTKYYETKPPYKCSTKKLLTNIEYEGDEAFLHINESVVPSYNNNGVKCCYETIQREIGEEADFKIKYSQCKNLKNSQILNTTEILVKCVTNLTNIKIYANTHSIIFKTPIIKEKIKRFNTKENKPLSVLIFGIDSLSRLNFHRMLPLTKSYLEKLSFIEYKGCHKIGENTFPNLMALLTGRNLTSIFKNYNPTKMGYLDKCNFIWKNYSDSGYITLYIEDTNYTTFTTRMKGFLYPPTDLYFKPYLTASEHLGVTIVDTMDYCSGPKSSSGRVLEVAKEYLSQIGENPKFGLFWFSTFSHDDVNSPARMDRILMDFFKDIQKYLKSTIVFFLSDHGIRYGSFRQTLTGWYEDNLPFAYFYFPESFQENFPNEYKNFFINRNKLTTPYDIHMTLQHILELQIENKSRSFCDATKNCKSLFENVGDRSCEDLDIPIRYCTCFEYKPYIRKSSTSQLAVEFALNELNRIIKSDEMTKLKCMEFQLVEIILAQKAEYKNYSYLLLQVKTKPKAIFEFTVSFDIGLKKIIKLEDHIGRLDKYSITSECVSEKKLYCYCRDYEIRKE